MTLEVHANRYGYRGVHWHEAKQRFVAEIWPGGVRHRLGRFLSAEAAARAYDRAARTFYGSAAHLNFPATGEKRTIPSRKAEGFCVRGHDLAAHGYISSRGTNCRVCNRDAAKRYYAKRIPRPMIASPMTRFPSDPYEMREAPA